MKHSTSSSRLRASLVLAVLFLTLGSAFAQTPQWIWHENDGAAPAAREVRFFRKVFDVKENVSISKAELVTCGDDHLQLFLNERQVADSPAWVGPGFKAQRRIVTRELRPGKNIFAGRVENSSVAAGLIVKLEITYLNGDKQLVVTDGSWRSAAKEEPGWRNLLYTDVQWANAYIIGESGMQPWGNILAPPIATPASELTLLPGFRAEQLRSAEPGEGSWVCMAIDDKGRLIISPQELLSPKEGGLLRVTLSQGGQVEKIEPLETPVGAAMGMLYAFDSLYVSGRGPKGVGIYRLRDTNNDDQFDSVELFKEFPGGTGEHGAHAIVLGPDQKLWIMNGNSTPLPAGIAPDSPFQHYAEDDLLPRVLDPVATFFDNLKIPYGYVLRTDADGKKWDLVSAGFRNAYDMDFNTDGELVTFDSDMEWDVGLPWYRPTRILHVVSGAEFGFREGNSKWPTYYPDSLPAVADVGLASPTGAKFGTKSHYPAKYKKAFFAMDWTYGRILAVHLQPDGATYKGEFESFVSGKPLPVTDLEFGLDGAMYFIIGGRGTQSGLYRVSYIGTETKIASAPASGESVAARSREQRKRLEAFHGKRDAAAIPAAWPLLSSSDRWLRYAARVAVESQDARLWQDRALKETNVDAALAALLALARVGSSDAQRAIFDALDRFDASQFNERQNLEATRILEIAFSRMGRPDSKTAEDIAKILNGAYPTSNPALNREVGQLLVYLQSPEVVAKTLKLLGAASTQQEQIEYATFLRNVKTGWTLELRTAYFDWFNRAQTEYKGGNSFGKFLEKIKKEAMATLTESERAALASVLEPRQQPAASKFVAAPRPFVEDWKMGDLVPLLDQVGGGRSFERGHKAFVDASCFACHLFKGDGGSVGPDITSAASRFSRKDLLEAIMDPSKVVSDQYLSTAITKRDSSEVTGLIVDEDAQKITVLINPITQQRVQINKTDIEKRAASRLSPMPEGLMNVLTKEEILDLLAYIESGGDPNHAVFRKKTTP